MSQDNNPESDSKPDVDSITNALKNVKLEETKDTPELDEKNEYGIIGMLDVEGKNIVTDLTSSKNWIALGVPEEIQKGLKLLAYQKPSLIQSFAIPQILKE